MAGDHESLHTLQVRLATLGTEHESMQQEYKRLYTYHGNKCATSLQGSMKSLLEVIVFVRKADKKLVDWHYRSDRLKTALRVVGLDRRTHTVIEKKTQKLQQKVQRVEDKFDQTGLVFDGGLQETKRMKSGFLEFSTGNVEEVSQKLLSTHDAYDEEHDRVDTLVRQQTAEHEDAQSKAEELTEQLEEMRLSHENAERSRTAWSAGAVVGFGVAAISAFVFPPSFMTTVPLLAASVAAGRASLSYNEQVQDLQKQKESLDVAISEHDASVQALKAELARSSHNLNACSEVIAKVEAFQRKNETFRLESQKSLNELYLVQVILDKAREKLRVIAKELHECRYEESRRGIAGRLREVLAAIQDVPKKVKSADTADPIDMSKATRELTAIEGKTEEILQIVRRSAQAYSG